MEKEKKEKKLKLFLIEQLSSNSEEAIQSCVIAARSKDEALNANFPGIFWDKNGLRVKLLSSHLSNDVDMGVISCSFYHP